MLEVVQDELAPGLVVGGRYRLVRIVGEGGMGVVWAAVHTLTGKKCALKFVKQGRADDPRSYRRMLLEAQSACAVKHPNVAQVHDILELPNGLPFIVMDFLEGEPLSARLARLKRLSLCETTRILVPVMEAVQAAHALGIVHRDLKPDNVFLEAAPNGEDGVRVLDFGIAKQMGAIADAGPSSDTFRTPRVSGLTTHSLLGTPSYMAPEQRAGARDVDGRADVWALGVILFECLTGERPEASLLAETARQEFLARELRALGSVELTEEHIQLFTRALAIAPEARPRLAEICELMSQRQTRAPEPPATAFEAPSLERRTSALRSTWKWVPPAVVGLAVAYLVLGKPAGPHVRATAEVEPATSSREGTPKSASGVQETASSERAHALPSVSAKAAASEKAAPIASGARQTVGGRVAAPLAGVTKRVPVAPSRSAEVAAFAPISNAASVGIPSHERR